MRTSILFMLGAILFSTASMAQDTVDTHGLYVAPTDYDLLDPIVSYRAERHEAGSAGIQGLFEYAREPLMLGRITNGVTSEQVLIQDLTALNLNAFYSPHERFSIGIGSPIYMSVDGTGAKTGVGIGDVRVSGAAGILLKEEEGVSFGLSVIPYLDIPGSYGDGNLGLNGVAGGGLAALSFGDDVWDVTGNAGIEFTPEVSFYNLTGGERLVTGLSAGYAFDDSLALRAETIFRPTLSSNEYMWTDSPLEASLSLRGYSGPNLGWTLGGSKGLSRGVSAADWRVFAGLGLSFGSRESSELICDACAPSEMIILVTDSDGELVESEIYIESAYGGGEVSSGQIVQLSSGGQYVVNVMVEQGDEIIYLSMPVFFDFNKSDLRFPEGQVALSLLAEALTAYPNASVVISGNTDERGSDGYNEGLSERRAETVNNFLVNELGVDPERLKQIGWGEANSYHSCGANEECHQLERRVDLIVE